MVLQMIEHIPTLASYVYGKQNVSRDRTYIIMPIKAAEGSVEIRVVHLLYLQEIAHRYAFLGVMDDRDMALHVLPMSHFLWDELISFPLWVPISYTLGEVENLVQRCVYLASGQCVEEDMRAIGNQDILTSIKDFILHNLWLFDHYRAYME